jgi:hypothetical protein
MEDAIGGAHMKQGALTSFTTDRFGNPYSALSLNKGYTIVPSGVYFNTVAFTISVWLYPKNIIGIWSRVIDFGSNGGIAHSNNILFAIGARSSLQPAFCIRDAFGNYVGSDIISSVALIGNQWQFVVVTFDGSTGKVYINGNLTETQTVTFYLLPTLTRTQNWVGKSSFDIDGYSSSYLDELRFYNVSLSQAQILQLMNYQTKTTTQKSKRINFFSSSY